MIMNRIVAVTLLVGSIVLRLSAQSEKTDRDLFSLKSPLAPMTTPQSPAGPALDGPVDAAQYYVGPSDVLTLNIWVSPPLTFAMTVTPEGTAIVPSVGEFRVVGLTLAETRELILREVRKKYLSGSPTVTLTSPRKILVTVSGGVRNPGRFVVSATDRVDKAIEEANQSRKDLEQANALTAPQSAVGFYQENRSITLHHRTGETVRVDLPKFYAKHDPQYNPYLREGDEVFVPSRERQKDMVGVHGAVRFPGTFELVQGDNLSDVVELAYGTVPHARRDSVLFMRFIPGGGQEMRIVNLDEIAAQKQEDVALLPGDRIIVLQRPELRRDYVVSVEGEVQYPGRFPITLENTRLSEVLRLAGGVTSRASLQGAELLRTSIDQKELYIERLLSARGSVSAEDSANYALESELRIQKERVNVDFVKLMLHGDSTQDVIVRPDDRVVIPSIRKNIYVFGQVVTPGNVPHISGESYAYYVRLAGGFTDKARTGDVMIIKSATRQWLDPSETEIEEGDYVWVPKDPERSFGYYMSIIGQTASVISVAVSVVLLALQLNK